MIYENDASKEALQRPSTQDIPISGLPASPDAVRVRPRGSNVPAGPRREGDDPHWVYRPPYSTGANVPLEPNRVPFVGMGGYKGDQRLIDRGLRRDWAWLKRPIAQMRRHGYTSTDVAAMFSVHPNAVTALYRRWGWKNDQDLGLRRVQTPKSHYLKKDRKHATNRSDRPRKGAEDSA